MDSKIGTRATGFEQREFSNDVFKSLRVRLGRRVLFIFRGFPEIIQVFLNMSPNQNVSSTKYATSNFGLLKCVRQSLWKRISYYPSGLPLFVHDHFFCCAMQCHIIYSNGLSTYAYASHAHFLHVCVVRLS